VGLVSSRFAVVASRPSTPSRAETNFGAGRRVPGGSRDLAARLLVSIQIGSPVCGCDLRPKASKFLRF